MFPIKKYTNLLKAHTSTDSTNTFRNLFKIKKVWNEFLFNL